VNNPIGDGVLSVDLALAFSAAVPDARVFFNLDSVYRYREHKRLTVGQIHDQVQFTLEGGWFIIPTFSLRLMVRYYETLGGAKLTFANQGLVTAGQDAMQLYENPLVYDQDAIFVGGGPYLQITEAFGIGANYVRAVWYRNHANLQTAMLSLSFALPVKKQLPP